MDSLNQRISKIIEYSALSPSEFADALEVPRSSISHIASGRNKPSLDFLIKVKNHFPELEWQWLIKGEGEMKSAVTEESAIPITPPDLFSIIDDDHFGLDEVQPGNSSKPQESAVAMSRPSSHQISDSQQSEDNNAERKPQRIANQVNKIKRIVLFFENGTFESFEP